MMQLVIRGIVHGGYHTAAEALDVAMRLELDDGDFEILEHEERLAKKEIDYKTGKFPFGPPMMCPTCKTKLQSKYRGEYVACSCGNAVDQTGHYSRYLGKLVPYVEQADFLMDDERGEL